MPASLGGSSTPTVAADCVMRPKEAKTSRAQAAAPRRKRALTHFNLFFSIVSEVGRAALVGEGSKYGCSEGIFNAMRQ